jgi:predicted phosphate transport protein (TIGR00153 family)
MFGWLQALMPRENRFFDLFRRHVVTIVAGAQALSTLLAGGPGAAGAHAEIIAREEEADAITREVRLALRRVFITPFDRGDIQALIGSLDDAIDQMLKTAKIIALFDFDRFEEPMRRMADIIVQAAELTSQAVGMLSSMRRDAHTINALAEQIIRLEESADGLYEQGLKALYVEHAKADAMGFIVGREIYDHLEKVVDRFEDVANQISDVLIENV